MNSVFPPGLFVDDCNFFTLMLSNGAASQFREQLKVNALVGIVEWRIHGDHHLFVENMAPNTDTQL